MKLRRHSRGVTLVELLVSISLGLVVAGAMVALYIGTARSYRQIEALGQLQSNARHVFEIMGYDIRMAGNMGCHTPAQTTPKNFVKNGSSYWWSNIGKPLDGKDETADNNAKGDGGFPNVVPGAYGPDALRGDMLIVLRADTEDNLGTVNGYNLGTGSIPFTDQSDTGFKKGSLLLLTDCQRQTVLFQKTGPADPAFTAPIEHALNMSSNALSPGNCVTHLDANADCPSTLPASTPTMTGAKLLPLSANAYYLRNSPYKYPNSNKNIPSLFRQTLGTKSGQVDTTAEELVSGVTDLQILYGVDTSTTSPSGVIGSYLTATQINAAGYDWSDPKRVLAVRVTITLESADDAVATESASFTLGNGSVIADRRLRRSYTMTFGIRQRLLP